ncbi:MAG: hypothetical protein PWP23_2045 [Candidatus Sumerlaeota bacterium]|nr:hypothetical protein [Candidatus Sumerlaeota bacterium]
MTTQAPETLEVDVFRAGDYGERGQYDEQGLDALAADYDAALHEAPVTLDHRQDGPAEGWVRGLRRMGDRLVATLDRLSPRLRELLATGAYKKRSVELYRRFSATQRPYLKAVSFLGAAAPAVKGLADPVFADGDGGVDRFEEQSPTAQAAEQAARDARQRLIDAGRWQPSWEEAGLPAVFAALGGTEQLDALVSVLATQPQPVAFGEALADGTHFTDDTAACFVGTPSPESLARHRKALAYLAAHPGTNYADALLKAG